MFSLDNRLHMLQDFSNPNAGALSAAVDCAYDAPSPRRRPVPLPGASREACSPVPGRAAGPWCRAPIRRPRAPYAVAQKMREMTEQMQALATSIETSQRGHATFYPLMALAKAQGALEGRKAILLFSEGMQVPSSVEEIFQATISSEANRANVSVYAIDSRGLDTSRDLAAAGEAVNKAGRVSQQAMAKRGAGGTSMDEVQNDDLVLSSFKSSAQSVLRELAEDTGGVLIANTNDLGKGLDCVTSDLASYYEIAYAPKNAEADGSFRRYRGQGGAQGRRRDLAQRLLRAAGQRCAPLLPYELPLLAAAAATPPPHAFDFQAGVFRFHETTRGRQFTLVTEVPVASLVVEEDKKAKYYHIRFTVMALVKDTNGGGGRAPQQHLSARRPAREPAGTPARQRRLQAPALAGLVRYTLTTVVRDQQADKVSVRQLPLRVFPESPGMDVSTVARGEARRQGRRRARPRRDLFRAGPMRIAPSLATPDLQGGQQPVSAFVVLYPDKAIATRRT